MSEQLITNIYTKLEKFNDPVSNKPLNSINKDVNVIYKDGHANITITIDPNKEDKYNIYFA